MIDLKNIKQNLTTEEIIELVCSLGADRYEERNEYIMFPSICHNEDSGSAKLKLYYYKNSYNFHCYSGCGESFDIFDLFQKRFELLGKKYNFYNDIVKVIAKNQKNTNSNNFSKEYKSIYEQYARRKIEINFSTISSNLLSLFSSNTAALVTWKEEGINEEALKKFNIKYSIEQNKIVIPHYDIDGNLIGLRGRALNEEDIAMGKYMPMQIEGKFFSHQLSFNLYGLNINKENIRQTKTAIIYEGEKSVLKQESFLEINNSVATCGSSIHKYQIDLLRKCGAETIIIAFDKEFSNGSEEEKYFNKLWNICSNYKHFCNMIFLFDRKGLLNLKDSPIDQGKEIFSELMKKGVFVN